MWSTYPPPQKKKPMTTDAPIVWQYWSVFSTTWEDLSVEESARLERVLTDPSKTMDKVEIATVSGCSFTHSFDVASMTWANIIRLRRCKADAISRCQYWDEAWINYSEYETALLVDAMTAGKEAVTLYRTHETYHIDLKDLIQTNQRTSKRRPIRLPIIPTVTVKDCDDGVRIEDMEGMPNEFYCPISHHLMSNPVVAADGFSYECEKISVWFSSKLVSPVTGKKMSSSMLTPNNALRKLIRDFVDERKNEEKKKKAGPSDLSEESKSQRGKKRKMPKHEERKNEGKKRAGLPEECKSHQDKMRKKAFVCKDCNGEVDPHDINFSFKCLICKDYQHVQCYKAQFNPDVCSACE